MRKYAYLARLEELLAALPAEERQEALNYYEEYFDAAGNENEEKTAAELGDPAEVARKILEGEGIDPEMPAAEAGTPAADAPESALPEPEKVSAAVPPVGPEPPKLDDPAQYPTKGIPEQTAGKTRGRRRLWIIYWLLIVLALAIQISALVFGLRGFSNRDGQTAASTAVSVEPAVTPIPTDAAGLGVSGDVTYSGILDTSEKGTLFVNLTRGNVAFRTGDQATVEVRNVDANNKVTLGQTVDYGYAFICDSTDPNTHVTITLPANAYRKLEVRITTSGAIELGDLQIEEITAYTASGPVQSGWLRTGTLDAKTEIGNIWLEKVSDCSAYKVKDVTLQAPSGYVAANFSAPRNQWVTEINAPGGITGTTTESSGDSSIERILHIESANKVNVQYGV